MPTTRCAARLQGRAAAWCGLPVPAGATWAGGRRRLSRGRLRCLLQRARGQRRPSAPAVRPLPWRRRAAARRRRRRAPPRRPRAGARGSSAPGSGSAAAARAQTGTARPSGTAQPLAPPFGTARPLARAPRPSARPQSASVQMLASARSRPASTGVQRRLRWRAEAPSPPVRGALGARVVLALKRLGAVSARFLRCMRQYNGIKCSAGRWRREAAAEAG